MHRELVSVIIPCFNHAKYVEETIISVLNQTYEEIEIVCINDGSTDNSSSVIGGIANKYKNIVFIDNKTNQGIVKSRNEAISVANGKYILPLDADDKIEPTYVEKAIKILDEQPEIGIVYCKARLFGKENIPWILPEFNRSLMLYENHIFCSAIYRKSDFIRVGGYKEYMKDGLEDWEFWLSMLELDVGVYRIDEELFFYRRNDELSRNDKSVSHLTSLRKELIQHHMASYLKDDRFIEKVFDNKAEYFKNKFAKHKKREIIFSVIAIIEFVLLVIFCFMNNNHSIS